MTKTAPRRFALAFFPALFAFVLIAMIIISIVFPTKPGDQGLVIPAIAFVALLFVALYALCLRMVAKSLAGWGK